MKRLFKKKPDPEDFTAFFDDALMPTKKRILLERCLRHDVSPYVDDASENVSGIYAQLRAVASESELERRLNAKMALSAACRANVFALLAFVVSFAVLIKDIFMALKP